MGLTPQKPEYRDIERDEREISRFLGVKLPKIQRLAGRMGADIGFQDESGVDVMTRHGKTWGRRGETPIVQTSMKRGGYNVIPVVATDGTLRYSVKDGNINGEVFVSFLKQLLQGRERPLVLLVDHATFHASKVVRDFVRSRRAKSRVFFLPRRAPEMNPDEQVWNEIKITGLENSP